MKYLIFSRSSSFSATFIALRTFSAIAAIAAITVTAAALAWLTRRTLWIGLIAGCAAFSRRMDVHADGLLGRLVTKKLAIFTRRILRVAA